jgi:hypothetical protein
MNSSTPGDLHRASSLLPDRFEDGKLVERGDEIDEDSLMKQPGFPSEKWSSPAN